MQFSYPEIDDAPKAPDSGAPEPSRPGKPRRSLAEVMAVAVSWVLVPLVMPVLAVILVFTLSDLREQPAHVKWICTGVVVAFNTVLPSLLIVLLKALGLVRDVALNNQNERLYPYIITTVALGCTGAFFLLQGFPAWVWTFYMGAAAGSVVNLLVNIKWKISAHANGVAGVVAMLMVMARQGHPAVNMTWWVVGALLLSGLLGSARVYLRRHTAAQVLAGYAVGFCCVYFAPVLWQHIIN